MLAVSKNENSKSKKVSIRYDKSNETYYCFYHGTDNLSSELILSYDIKENKWCVDTIEYKNIFEEQINELLNEQNILFEEQIRYVIDILDAYFADQSSQQKKTKNNAINHRIHSFSWFRRLRGIRRWASQDNIFYEKSPVLKRYSTPEKSTNNQIKSTKVLPSSSSTDNLSRAHTKAFKSLSEQLDVSIQHPIMNKAPSISKIWLNLVTDDMEDFRKKLGTRTGEEKLKKLAEKFVIYFGGTFQCTVGHEYQLEFDYRKWYFVVLKVELWAKKHIETTKLPKTKIVFIIDSIPHCVRS